MTNPLATRMALLMLILVAAGCSHSKANSLTVTIQPKAVSIPPGETVAFKAVVSGPVEGPTVWSVKEGSEGGTVSKEGVYTAPASPGLFHVIAMVIGQNQTAVYATAEVTVIDEIRGDVSSRDGGSGSGNRDTRAARDRDTGSAVASTGSVSRDSKGWTVVTRASDARMIYVSSSTGNDKNDGSEEAPLKTIAAGIKKMRRGFPDWLLLKAGDTWKESILGPASGRSATEPSLITAYGSGARPQINPVGESAYWNLEAPHIYLIGLDFYNPERDPSSSSFKDGVASPIGVMLIDGGNDLLIEDCLFRYLSEGLNIQGNNSVPDKIQLRRNVIVDMYSHDAHSQGSYFHSVSNLLIEENIFDHNGWITDPKVKPNSRNAPNVFNHDIYLEGSFNHVAIRGNIFMRSGSLAVAMVNNSPKQNFSSDTLVENNFFFRGEIGLSVSYGTEEGKLSSGSSSTGFTIQNNVLLQINRENPTKRDIGWGMSFKSLSDSIIKDNIFSDFSFTDGAYALAFLADDSSYINSGLTISGNLAYRIREQALLMTPMASWSDIKVTNNEFQDPDLGAAMVVHRGPFSAVTYSGNVYSASKPAEFAIVAKRGDGEETRVTYEQWVAQSGETGSEVRAVSYPEPQRNLESYVEKKSLTLSEFFSAIRQQSKATWDSSYTAAEINNYIRAGFGRKAL